MKKLAHGMFAWLLIGNLLGCGEWIKDIGDSRDTDSQDTDHQSILATDQLFGKRWIMVVDRVWNRENQPQFPMDTFSETDYEPTSDDDPYFVTFSDDGLSVTIEGKLPEGQSAVGHLESDDSVNRLYNLLDGTFAGGRFVIWIADNKFQAEFTIYGSGVPIIYSKRGKLVESIDACPINASLTSDQLPCVCNGKTVSQECYCHEWGVECPTPDVLILRPDTITFFELEVAAVGWYGGFTGHDPVNRVCATVLFWAPKLDGTTWKLPESGYTPEVFLQTNTDGPCVESFAGFVTVESAYGYVDFSERVLQNFASSNTDLNQMADLLILFKQGEQFSSLSINNRETMSPAPVVFGISFISDVPENFYVQTQSASGYPSWVSIRHANGDPVMWFYDLCDAGVFELKVSNLTAGANYGGSIYLTWYGEVYYDVSECEPTRIPVDAAPGDYIATFCYGTQVQTDESGTYIVSPTCEEKQFTYPPPAPDMEVVLYVNWGG